MSMAVVLAALAAVPTGGFDCDLSQIAAVSVEQGKATAGTIDGLPADAKKFHLQFFGNNVAVDWPGNPIQAAGKNTVLPTGPGAGMVLFVSAGPCLFTEQACATMINFAQQPNGSLKLLITPTALTLDQDHKTRYPFLVLIDGQCVARKQ